jgi:hypothetical protein
MITKAAVERLKNAFLTQEVIFFLKQMDVTTADQEGNQITVAAMVPGYVIDICENFWWVGSPDGQVTRVISHDVAPMVELAVPGALEMMDLYGNMGDEGGGAH